MKRTIIPLISIPLLFFLLCSFSWAGMNKRIELKLKDEKVSADLQNATLGEVAAEIGKTWGIRIETYGEVDRTRLISVKFDAISPMDSLERLLRGVNFLYIPGEKLCLLGFGESSSKNQAGASVISVPSPQNFPMAGQSLVSGEMKKPDAGKEIQAHPISAATEGTPKGVVAFSGNIKSELSAGETAQTTASQTSGEVNQSPSASTPDTSKNNGFAPFTAPIVLESNGQAVSGLSNEITYNPNLLTNPRVTLGEAAKQAGKEVIYNEPSPGRLKVGIIGLNQNAIPDGTVAQITFDVVGTGQISWNNQPRATDPSANTVPVTFKNGKITPVK